MLGGTSAGRGTAGLGGLGRLDSLVGVLLAGCGEAGRPQGQATQGPDWLVGSPWVSLPPSLPCSVSLGEFLFCPLLPLPFFLAVAPQGWGTIDKLQKKFF